MSGLYEWEKKEAARRLTELHVQRAMNQFLIDSLRSLFRRVNETDPVLAGEILDIVEDAMFQIGATINNGAKLHPVTATESACSGDLCATRGLT